MGDEDDASAPRAGETSWSADDGAEEPKRAEPTDRGVAAVRSEAGASDISFVGAEPTHPGTDADEIVPQEEETGSLEPTLTGVHQPLKKSGGKLEDRSTATMAHPAGHPAELEDPSTATMAHPAAHPAQLEDPSTATMAHPAAHPAQLEDPSTATMAHPAAHPAQLEDPSTATMAHPASHPAGPEDLDDVSTASMVHPAQPSETDVDALAAALQAPDEAPAPPAPPQATIDPKPVQQPVATEHLPPPKSVEPLRAGPTPKPPLPAPPLPSTGEDPHPTLGVLLKVRAPFADPARITVFKRELLAVALGEHPDARRPSTPEEADAWADQESIEMSFDDLGDELFDGTEALTNVGPAPERPEPNEAPTGVHDPADAPTGVHHSPPKERPPPPARPSKDGPDPTRFGQDITAPGAGTARSEALRARRLSVAHRAADLGGSGKLLGHTVRKNLGVIPNSGHSGELDRIPLMQSFSPAGAKLCQPLGLRTLADWVARAVHFVGRRLLAEALGLPTTTVLLTTLRAELMDLPINLVRGKPPHPKDIRLLARMGIYSVHDLARLNQSFDASPQRALLLAELMSKLQKQVPQWKGKARTTRHELKEWAYAATKRGSDLLLTPTHADFHWECAADAVLAWYLTHRTSDPQLVFDEAALRLVILMGEHAMEVDSSTLDQLSQERKDTTVTDLNDVLSRVRAQTQNTPPAEGIPPTEQPYLRFTSRNTDWMLLDDLYPWSSPDFDRPGTTRCFWIDPVPTLRASINAGGPSMPTMDPVYLGFDGQWVSPQTP